MNSSHLSRRQLLQLSGLGFGTLVLSHLNARQMCAERPTTSNAGSARPPHFSAQAKSVIMLMQNGGPGQMDLFDPKPALHKHAGTVHAERVEMFQPGSEANKLLPGPFRFVPRGECGMPMAEILPQCLPAAAIGAADEMKMSAR